MVPISKSKMLVQILTFQIIVIRIGKNIWVAISSPNENITAHLHELNAHQGILLLDRPANIFCTGLSRRKDSSKAGFKSALLFLFLKQTGNGGKLHREIA